MPVFRLLKKELTFPNPELAEEKGLLAIGGDLSPERILLAYSMGIFPWYNPGEPILWWSPDPRFVLYPEELKISKSMRPYFNQGKFRVTADHAFEAVIKNCKMQLRHGQAGTWITESMQEAYVALHRLGYAHSVEVWNKDNKLVGGLYGIALGKVFSGESMFAHESNASKFGFISLVQKLRDLQYNLVDCQQETQHLGSLGARPIARDKFLEIMQKNPLDDTHIGSWHNWFT